MPVCHANNNVLIWVWLTALCCVPFGIRQLDGVLHVSGCIPDSRRLYWHNTVFAWTGLLSMHKLYTSCIRRCLVSRAHDWVVSALSAMLLIFSLQFSLLFFHISVTMQHQHCSVLLVRTSGVAENLGRYVSCTERTAQGKDFELTLTVKLETRHPLGGPFGSEFPVICNYCRVMAAWSRKTWKFFVQFFKRLLMVKFLKFCSESLHGDTNWRCCVQMSWIYPTGNWWNRELFTWQKNISCLSDCRCCSDCAQNPPGPAPTMCSQCSRFHSNRFTFSGVIAERVNAIFYPIEYFHYSSKVMLHFGRIIMMSLVD